MPAAKKSAEGYPRGRIDILDPDLRRVGRRFRFLSALDDGLGRRGLARGIYGNRDQSGWVTASLAAPYFSLAADGREDGAVLAVLVRQLAHLSARLDARIDRIVVPAATPIFLRALADWPAADRQAAALPGLVWLAETPLRGGATPLPDQGLRAGLRALAARAPGLEVLACDPGQAAWLGAILDRDIAVLSPPDTDDGPAMAAFIDALVARLFEA